MVGWGRGRGRGELRERQKKKKEGGEEGRVLIRRSFSPVAPVKTQRPPQLSERDTLALCIQPSLCVWGREERVRACVLARVRVCQCASVCGGGRGREGEAAVQGTAMAGGALLRRDKTDEALLGRHGGLWSRADKNTPQS